MFDYPRGVGGDKFLNNVIGGKTGTRDRKGGRSPKTERKRTNRFFGNSVIEITII